MKSGVVCSLLTLIIMVEETEKSELISCVVL